MRTSAACVAVAVAFAGCRDCQRTTSRAPDGRLDAHESARASTPPYDQIAISGTRACAREVGGNVACWGDGDSHRALVPEWSSVSIVRGGARIGVLRSDRTVRASGTQLNWPDPFEGSEQQRALVDVADFAISQWRHACASFTSGEVACWGEATEKFALGRGGEAITTPMPRIEGLRHIRAFALGAEHSCALAVSGQVLCWGSDEVGQLGDGRRIAPFSERYQPTPPSSGGPHHGVARRDSPLATPVARKTPAPVTGLPAAVEIVAGNHHTCARSAAGEIGCWGNDEGAQLGPASLPPEERPEWASQGTFSGSSRPVVLAGIRRAIAMSAHEQRTCAVIQADHDAGASSSEVLCWGAWRNPRSKRIEQHRVPERIRGLDGAAQLALGDSFTCALLVNGEVRCWGDNARGQLGDGTTVPREAPSP